MFGDIGGGSRWVRRKWCQRSDGGEFPAVVPGFVPTPGPGRAAGGCRMSKIPVFSLVDRQARAMQGEDLSSQVTGSRE